MPLSTFVELAVILLCCSPCSKAGGTLGFLSLYSYSSISTDDGYSSRIFTGGFNFGTSTVNYIYVSSNGYISMGVLPSSYSPTIPSTTSIVAPYAADIDPSVAGTVQYTQFTTSSSSQRSTVSSFIRSQTGNSFYGTRMMVAEWNAVAEHGGSSYTTSSFQCVLITDGSSSYAVFIYDCDGMEWSGATIGWAASSYNYATYVASGSNSESIGCLYSSTYSAIVYRLDGRPCDADEYTCGNGDCVNEYYTCDGDNDCGDNSDELGCCDSDEFTCDNGKCVPSDDKCDGEDDCGDDSDEQGCCGSYEFICDNGQCVPSDFYCDGEDDCDDDSDEQGCLNVRLVVGISVGIFSLLVFIGVTVAICGFVYCGVHRRRRTVVTHVVTTTPGTEPLLSPQECAVNDSSPQQSTPYPTQMHAKSDYPPTAQVYQPPP